MTTPSLSRVSLGNGFYRFHSEVPKATGTCSSAATAGAVQFYIPYQDEPAESEVGLVPVGVSSSLVKISKITANINASWMPGGGRLLVNLQPESGDAFWHIMCKVQEPEQQHTEDFNPPTIMLPAHELCVIHQWNARAIGWTGPWGWSQNISGGIQVEYQVVA